jgi:hypothetical protein
VIGGGEILLGLLCLTMTSTVFFLFVCLWKLGTEWLHVPAQAFGAWWEVIERGSSYAAPLLWIGLQQFLCAHSTVAQGGLPNRWLDLLKDGVRRLFTRTLFVSVTIAPVTSSGISRRRGSRRNGGVAVRHGGDYNALPAAELLGLSLRESG